MTPPPASAPRPVPPARPARRRAGFTLVEILLVVALLALAASLFVSSIADLLRAREPRPDEIFWQGVTAARQLALETNRTVTLHYDKDKHQLAWATGPENAHTLGFPGRLLEFLPATEQGSILLGGQLAETGGLNLIRFYPDGGCDAFRAQLTDGADHRTVLTIDPWTCAPMLAAGAP